MPQGRWIAVDSPPQAGRRGGGRRSRSEERATFHIATEAWQVRQIGHVPGLLLSTPAPLRRFSRFAVLGDAAGVLPRYLRRQEMATACARERGEAGCPSD